MQTQSKPQVRSSRLGLLAIVAGGIVLVLGLLAVGIAQGGANVVTLAIPTFLAGILSFLSPCTLPVLPAYFAWTFGLNSGEETDPVVRQRRVLLSSLAFFAGLATTLVALGVITATVFASLVARNLDWVTRIGGAVIIVLGVLSIFGKGFAGPAIKHNSAATYSGAYLYGLTFAIGWTACIGPILGSILVMLASSGASAIAGATLTFIYVLGLGLPLMLVATFFNRLGQGSRAWRWLRGRVWEVNLGGRTLLFHSTSVLSGLLLVGVGYLLISGQLSVLNQYAGTSEISRWADQIQYDIRRFFTGE